MSQFSLTNYFDFSTTASCGNSPIIITSVGTGCSAAVQGNVGGLVCNAYGKGEYKMYSTVCSATAMDLSAYKRNYVVKSVYHTSSTCEGEPLQAFALAADSMCHMNPSGDNATAYLKTNCNGGQPIWQECSDASCTVCKTSTFSEKSCSLTGAGSSNKVFCVLAATSTATGTSTPTGTSAPTGTSTGIKNTTDIFGEEPSDPFSNSAMRRGHHLSIGTYLCITLALVAFFNM